MYETLFKISIIFWVSSVSAIKKKVLLTSSDLKVNYTYFINTLRS